MNQSLVARARVLRANPTDAERTLWQHIRRRQLGEYRFRRQHPIGPYIVDFLCFERRLVIEIDGGQHTSQAAYDLDRTRWLEARGYHVLRFWNHQVLNELQAVKEAILEALRRPPPQSSP